MKQNLNKTFYETQKQDVELVIGKSVQGARAISQEAILNNLGSLPDDNEHSTLHASDTPRAAIDEYPQTKESCGNDSSVPTQTT